MSVPLADDDDDSLVKTGCRLFCVSQIAHLDRPVPWVWHGYLARQHLTLLTGQWKVGKTTLLAALLARLHHGGVLAGRPVSPGRAVVVTEEGANLWLTRATRHGIGDGVRFAFNPFVRKPLPRQWGYLMEDLAAVHGRGPVDLVVIDPLAAMLPGREEASAAAMTEALRPVRELAWAGSAVLLLHHPRKGAAPAGQQSRGTGALPAGVDFLIEMRWRDPAAVEDRRRRLDAWSRYEETPRRVVVELSPDGTDYAVVPPDATADEPTDPVSRTLEQLLRAEPGLTLSEIHAAWPAGAHHPARQTLLNRVRWLTATGRLTRSGSGHRYEPHRYSAGARESDRAS
jgi:AAA domain